MTTDEQMSTPKQPYDYYAFLDFEANCVENDETFFREIIEFPIVLVNSKTLKVEKEFQIYVKPTVNKLITPFCTKLTGINQKHVETGVSLDEALEMVHGFLNENKLLSSDYSFIFVTDGPWDFRDFLSVECEKKKISMKKYFTDWVNIRKSFCQYYKTKPMGIQKMVSTLNLEFVGIAHQGLDDSRNIANIGIEMMKQGAILQKNASLKDTK